MAALKAAGANLELWIAPLPGGWERLSLSMGMGAGSRLIKQVFAEAGPHIARILVESNGDEYGAEHVVLANCDGLLARTQHINIDTQRTEEGVPYAFIDLITNPSADLPDDLLDDYPPEILADPITVVDHPEFHHVLRSGDGAYGSFPVDEGLTNESDDWNAVLDGP